MNGEQYGWVEEQRAHLKNLMKMKEEIAEMYLIRVVCRRKRPVFEVTVVREINCCSSLCSLQSWKS